MVKYVQSTDPSEILNDVARWPLVVHLLSAMFCLGSSAIYHLCHVKSKTVGKYLTRLDYGGICILIMGSPYPALYYAFACEPVHGPRNLFFIVITSTCLSVFFYSLTDRFDKGNASVRATVFVILGIAVAAPFIYLGLCEEQSSLSRYRFWPWLAGGAVYIFGATLYGLHIPERLSPCTFDLVGASHQLFHVCVVVAAAIHLQESYALYLDRFDKVCPFTTLQK